MRSQLLVQKTTKGICRGIGSLSRTQGQQAVAVHLLHPQPQSMPGGGDHLRQKEAGGFIGYDQTGALGQGLEEAFAPAGGGLHIGHVAQPGLLAALPVDRHAIDHEAVQALTGPGIVDAQGFQQQQRLAQLLCPVDGMLQGEVRLGPPLSDHPVEDV